jgi:hypothetical protein
MIFRTDLALERKEYIEKDALDGIVSERKEVDSVVVTTITVLNEKGEKILSKPKGKYITLEIGSFMKNSDLFSPRLTVLSDEIKKLVPEEGTVLVAGLGNEKITPDALGPKCASLILATRHISKELAKSIGFETPDIQPFSTTEQCVHFNFLIKFKNRRKKQNAHTVPSLFLHKKQPQDFHVQKLFSKKIRKKCSNSLRIFYLLWGILQALARLRVLYRRFPQPKRSYFFSLLFL